MALWSNPQWGTTLWGSPDTSGTVTNYAAIQFFAEPFAVVYPIMALSPGTVFDVAIDSISILSANESLSSQSWAATNSALQIVAQEFDGSNAFCRFNNNLPLGFSSELTCTFVTNYGRVFSSTIVIVSKQVAAH